MGNVAEKGAVWVAIRIPDGCISGHANQSRIHHFPLNDPENCLYAPDVITFARKKGFFQGADAQFSFCDAYCPADWGGLRGCEARVWSAFRLLGGANFDADKYLDFAKGENPDNKMPLYIRPEEKVTVKALADVMRDHYEGTPLDFCEDPGAGPSRLPYRWRPMTFREGNGSMIEYSPTSAFWLFNRVAHFAYLFYDRAEPEVRAEIDRYENENLALVKQLDNRALKMVENGNRKQAVAMLTEFCARRSDELFHRWDNLSNYLLVKYMDGNVKRQNEDGSFQDNGSGKNIPESPNHPKFREKWLRSIVESHGEVIEIKR